MSFLLYIFCSTVEVALQCLYMYMYAQWSAHESFPPPEIYENMSFHTRTMGIMLTHYTLQ